MARFPFLVLLFASILLTAVHPSGAQAGEFGDTWTEKFVEKDFEAALKETEGKDSENAVGIRGWSLFMLDRYGESLSIFLKLKKKMMFRRVYLNKVGNCKQAHLKEQLKLKMIIKHL